MEIEKKALCVSFRMPFLQTSRDQGEKTLS